MKPGELSKCAKHLGMSQTKLRELVGASPKAEINAEQARCIRAMVLKPVIRERVMTLLRLFPRMELASIRRLGDDVC
jgi:hypothetical protein